MALLGLWDDANPSLVCSGPVSLGREMLAITYEGKSFDACSPPSTVDKAERKARTALAAVHEHGFEGHFAVQDHILGERSAPPGPRRR